MNKALESCPSMTAEDHQRLQKAANDFYYMVMQLFAYYTWFRYISPQFPQLDKNEEYHCRMVKNAVVESQLMQCRRLNEFFYPRPKQEKFSDNLRAYKFGFEKLGPFLNEKEKNELNKSIAHPTLRPADAGSVSFDIYRFSWLAVRHSLDFANYLQISFFANNPEQAQQAATSIKLIRADWLEWTANMPVNERRTL